MLISISAKNDRQTIPVLNT